MAPQHDGKKKSLWNERNCSLVCKKKSCWTSCLIPKAGTSSLSFGHMSVQNFFMSMCVRDLSIVCCFVTEDSLWANSRRKSNIPGKSHKAALMKREYLKLKKVGSLQLSGWIPYNSNSSICNLDVDIAMCGSRALVRLISRSFIPGFHGQMLCPAFTCPTLRPH